jgi:RecB family exonuclease
MDRQQFDLQFLDWDKPCLQRAADFLLGLTEDSNRFDLGELIVVLPASRAVRRLTELLLERALEVQAVLTPPKIITVGSLPEQLYSSEVPTASELDSQIAWVQSLKNFESAELEAVFGTLPEEEDFNGWMKLAGCLMSLWKEVSGAGLDFETLQERASARMPGFDDCERWQLIAEIHRCYLRLLEEHGLADLQAGRLHALESGLTPPLERIFVIGCPDLNRLARRFLEAVADKVTILIHAPERLSARFDESGCLKVPAWRDSRIDIPEQCVAFTVSAREQVLACSEFITELGQISCDDISIGVGDTAHTSSVVRQLKTLGIQARDAAGKPLGRLSPLRLLRHLQIFMKSGHYGDFATLLRHPDLERWILQKFRGQGLDMTVETLRRDIDLYYRRHLPREMDSGWLVSEDQGLSRPIQVILDAVRELTESLTTQRLALHQWPQKILSLLGAVYGETKIHRREASGREILGALTELKKALADISQIQSDLAPIVDGGEAIRVLLGQLQNTNLSPEGGAPEVEVLGWLELHLDDAPYLAVTGVNEGAVPEVLNGDPFLPDSLRTALELLDNDRRYARDVYALSAMLASRKRMKLIASQTDDVGAAQMPSRLLMACSDNALYKRVGEYYSHGLPDLIFAEANAAIKTALQLPPRPIRLPRIERISATALKDYLACPYRYYLTHCLRLDEMNDDAREMDGGQFGSFIHDILREFNGSEVRDSVDGEKICAFLWRSADELMNRRFGSSAQPAVRLQLFSIKSRLADFAVGHAERASEGWRLRDAEYKIEFDRVPEVFPETLAACREAGMDTRIVARIDRIEYNPGLGKIAVIDYKTADKEKAPGAAHFIKSTGEWRDLQLPLYYHLLRAQGVSEPMELAYVVLPRRKPKSAWMIANWDEAALEAARGTIDSTMAGIIRQEFWPPSESVDFDRYAGICHTPRRAVVLDDEEE